MSWRLARGLEKLRPKSMQSGRTGARIFPRHDAVGTISNLHEEYTAGTVYIGRRGIDTLFNSATLMTMTEIKG